MSQSYPESALLRLARLLDGCDARWVVGGSTGLAIRGARMDRAPRDLDIYADENAIPVIHHRLKHAALDGPSRNETDRYRSILSHYRLDDTIVELVGDFKVFARGSTYITQVDRQLYAGGDIAVVQGSGFRLVPLGHELLFNILRERPDRAALIGQLIGQDPQRHMPQLKALMRINALSAEVEAEALRFATTGSFFGKKDREE